MNLTPEERRAVKGALRRAFRQSPRMRDVLTRARVELPPALKKDGTPGKKNQVRYTCASCGNLFPQKYVQVDHRDPVVPLGLKEEDMSANELVAGIFCDPSNLQVMCSTPLKFLPKGQKSCHTVKSAEENFIRAGLAKSRSGSLFAQIETLRGEFKQYLKDKENARLEKEARKLKKLESKRKVKV